MTEPTSLTPPEPEGSEPLTGPPRWVKAFIAIAAALILLFLVLKLTGQAEGHGPGRHGRTFDRTHLTLAGSTSARW